jgi:VWFA-related protein
MKFTDLAQAREAAFRNVAKSLRPSERAAVYTTSGQTMLDFADDRERLRQTLEAIRPQNPFTQPNTDCPPMTVYMADQITNHDDGTALSAAMADAIGCAQGDLSPDEAAFRARNAATRTVALADRNIRSVLATIDGVIAKLSRMAGQHTMVLVSSGFVMLDDRRQDEIAVLERAVRAGIVVNTLDARALYALTSELDASAHTIDNQIISAPMSGPGFTGYTSVAGEGGSSLLVKAQESRDGAFASRDVMAEFAENTGGVFIENTNDLDGGFARLADAPEFIYILGFNPENLKSDGRYHALEVTIHDAKGLAVEARRGYYAPHYAEDSPERAKEEIEEAFFSRDEIHDIPVVMQTQFIKTTAYKATASVAAKVDIRQIQFRKEGDRNRNDLTVVSGLFDPDGNYVSGTQKIVELRLLDATLESRLEQGLTVKTTFDVTPGNYVVRLVVRDAEGRMMAAENGAIEIP